MSTTHLTYADVTLPPCAREALREIADQMADAAGEDMRYGHVTDATHLHDLVSTASRALAVMQAAEGATLPAEHVAATVDAAREYATEVAETLEVDTERRGLYLAGDEGWGWCGAPYHWTHEQNLAEYDRLIAQGWAQVAASEALLAALAQITETLSGTVAPGPMAAR